MSEAAEEVTPTCSKDLEQMSVEVDGVPAIQADILPAADLVFMGSQEVEVLMSTCVITLGISKVRLASAADLLKPDWYGKDDFQMPVWDFLSSISPLTVRMYPYRAIVQPSSPT